MGNQVLIYSCKTLECLHSVKFCIGYHLTNTWAWRSYISVLYSILNLYPICIAMGRSIHLDMAYRTIYTDMQMEQNIYIT